MADIERRGSGRRWLGYVARLLVGVGLLALCLWSIDLAALPRVLVKIDPALAALATLLAILGTVVLPAMVTRRALEIERIRLSLWTLTIINFAIRFYVLVLPRAASIAIRWARYRRGGSGHDALALMAFERLVQLFTMTLVGTLVLAHEYMLLTGHGPAVLAVSGLATLLLGLGLVPFMVPGAAPWLERLSSYSDRLAPPWFAIRLRRLLDAVGAFQSLRPEASRGIVVLSLLGYLLFILSAYAVALAMDLDVTLAALAWIRPLVFLLTLLPFTVGGLGIREAGFIGLLGLYGVPGHEALAFSLALFGIQVLIGLIGAATEIWSFAWQKWRKAP